MERTKLELGGYLFLAVVTVAAIYGLVRCITYRRTADIIIQARQWEYWAAIKYDTQEVRIVTDEDCTGTGEDKECTTTTRLEHYTESHMRCQNTRSGEELPPLAPDLACTMAPGDYKRENVTYWVTYLEMGKKDATRRTFSVELWDKLGPGTRRSVVVDILGNIREFAKE